MVEETGTGMFFPELRLEGPGQEKRELEFTDGTLPVELLAGCSMGMPGTVLMLVVVFKLHDGGQEEHQDQQEGDPVSEFPNHFFFAGLKDKDLSPCKHKQPDLRMRASTPRPWYFMLYYVTCKI